MVKRIVILWAVLMGVWLLLSGQYIPLILAFGVVSVSCACLIAYRINAHDSEGLPLHLMLALPRYILWLFGAIITSSIATIKVILGAGSADSVLFTMPYSQKTPAAIVTHANSITLTPGTVVLDMFEGGFTVHALTAALADDVKGGVMDRKIANLEGRGA